MTMLETVFNVFTAIAEWLTEIIPVILGIFYNTESGLTFIGILAVCGLGFSIIFLCLGLVQGFLKWR